MYHGTPFSCGECVDVLVAVQNFMQTDLASDRVITLVSNFVPPKHPLEYLFQIQTFVCPRNAFGVASDKFCNGPRGTCLAMNTTQPKLLE